jgi:hypothetical protein
MDRTAGVKYCAVVRMQDWTKEENYHEMTNNSRCEDRLPRTIVSLGSGVRFVR